MLINIVMDKLYSEDILKDNFEQQTISLKNDYEGKAIATLVRRLPQQESSKAILYLHGFNDYFFQSEMALQFNNHNFNFYALDLRKYGRSYLPHQKFNDIRDLRAYYEEVTYALNIIRNEGNKEVILFGHSTGGLLVTLFAKDHFNSPLFDGLILNSPFFVFNQGRLVKMLLPIVSSLGKIIPKLTIAGGFSEEYGKSIHQSFFGEWDYNLNWKPNVAPKVNLGWVRAIYKAQAELRHKFVINKPVLIMHSDRSVSDIKDKAQIKTCDVILKIKDIDHIARNIYGDVDIVVIKGGIHDLILSQIDARKNVYNTIFSWINKHNL